MSRVLIVHADPEIGARLAAAVMETGLDAVVVTSGERAMDRFIQEPADVVVIDYDLGGRDGVTAAEAIRWMPGGRRARLILTAQGEPPDGALATLANAIDPYATRVGVIEPKLVAEMISRAAEVRPHDAETRVLSPEQALLHAQRMRSPTSEARPAASEETSGVSLPSESAKPIEVEDTTLDDEESRERWELSDPLGEEEGEEVQRIAREESASEVMGSFAHVRFVRVLGHLADRRATGALICVHPPDERETTSGAEPIKIVYFRSGVPVHVRSNVVRECLGHVLERQRRIGPATLKESIEAVRRGEGRQGEVLMRMGAISPVELSEGLAEQLRLKLFDLFFWVRGSYRFTFDRPVPSELIDLEMGLAEIAFRGTRLSTPPPQALEMLGAARRRFVIPRARALVRFVRMEIYGPGLREMLRLADGTKTVQQLLDASGNAGEAAQLLVAMEALDALRFEIEPLRPRREPLEDDGARRERAPTSPAPTLPTAPTSDRPPPRSREMDTPREPRPIPAPTAGDAEEATSGPSDTFDLGRLRATLAQAEGGQPDAEPESGRSDTFDLGKVRATLVQDEAAGRAEERARLAALSSEVLARSEVSAAASIDRSDSRRVEDGSSDEPFSGDPANDDARDGSEAGTAVAARTHQDDERADAPRGPAPPWVDDDATTHPRSEPDRSASTRVLASPIEPLPLAASDEPSVEPRADESSLGEVDAPDAPSVDGAPAPSGPQLDARVEAQLRAERHFRRGLQALDRNKPDAALDSFRTAAELCPDEARFAMHVVYVQCALAPDDHGLRETSLATLEDACLRDPSFAAAHLLRARLLALAERRADAERAYARVLELEPSHRAAKLELKALRAS
ncbi:MAG: DUF4388 domain-containing protein [Sandaracinaceae bacterium]